ncbi:MAG TPA: bifunctional alpha/beta hydrolase/class I SAM-dependent methyltransferase [Lacipirellulaceae bacterium]|nr:bifunctional alpha/beta hydrolase/class I SAM-dependent methyltransferase [Lacipirellulaceae bacterium]
MSQSAIAERPPATRTATEHTFGTSDGVELFFRAWAPAGESRRAVVLFHRGHEHSARWQDFVERIGLDDFWFFAWDARGHGRSPGERGYAESFGRMVRDADEFVRGLSGQFDIAIENMAVVGQSVGAVLATTWVHDYAPPIRALAIATPALRVRLYVPLAIPGLRLLRRFKPKSFIRSYVKPRMLTHDEEQARAYAADVLISPQIAVNILLDLYDTSKRLVADAGAITTPTLLLVSGRDWVVDKMPQHELFARLSSPNKEKVIYPEFFHSTYWEAQRQRPIDRTREFILSAFEKSAAPVPLLEADKAGYTKRVFDQLECPMPITSPKSWSFAAQRIFLRTVGRLSKGIRIGWQTGFDSGQSLDHVYRNSPDGTSILGRWIDGFYLNSPGWRGIRQRKVHLQQLLDEAIELVRGRHRAIHILDIAAGPGRYVLDTIARQRDRGVEISGTLCDRDRGGLAAGRELAASMGITSATYRESDALDADAIAAIQPRPNIAIVSGLYELFPSNAPVRESLRGLAAAVEPGGLLIYTNQPWHPQQEMIARVLPNRDGEPWVMRCRTQGEMDQLVAAAGFEKRRMLIDDEGIFSVSLAERR